MDMSVDECRVMMRKLGKMPTFDVLIFLVRAPSLSASTNVHPIAELETYANVISTFRAQGGLSQQKLNLLTELRNLLNIGQDRHRAETRRATNDEELATIADR